jgi:benzoyl-CoA reductase subunit C
MTDAKENVERIVAEADALYHDLDFGAVKRFKEAHPEAKVIGCLPTYSPKEIIHAAGMLPVHLRGAGDQVEIIRGDAYFQSYICQIPRGIIELALSGRLRASMASSSRRSATSSATCRASGSCSSPKSSPATSISRRTSTPPWAGASMPASCAAPRRPGAALGREGDRRRPAPRRSPLYNDNRTSIEALMSLRAERAVACPPTRPTCSCAPAMSSRRGAHGDGRRVRRRWSLAARPPGARHSRVVMSGAFCEQPPLGLIKTLERAGCYIVWDDMTIGHAAVQRRRRAPTATRSRPRERVHRARRGVGVRVRAAAEGRRAVPHRAALRAPRA